VVERVQAAVAQVVEVDQVVGLDRGAVVVEVAVDLEVAAEAGQELEAELRRWVPRARRQENG
jgi:hypothetical protein